MDLNDLWNQKEFALQILIFIVQVLSLFFLGVYVWKTWQMASSTKASAKASEKMIAEMRDTRDQESAPYLVPFININHNMMYFGIKNIGKTVAKNIKLEIEPELKQHIGNIKDISLIKNGLSSLPPGHEIGTNFAVSHKYLNQAESPKKYLAKITFLGGLSNEQKEYEQILDLSVYHDLILNEDKQLSDIVKELENLSKNNLEIGENLKKINENFLEGIWIKNPDLFMQNGKDDSKYWKSIAISKLSELKLILSWMLEESYNFPPNNTQIRMNSLAMQLSVISSNYSTSFNSKVNEKITSLAKNLINFSGSDHFFYGRKLEGFTEEINKYKSAINELIELIEAS